MKPCLLVIGPLPPPWHGVSVSTSLVLANKQLRQSFDVRHLDTSDHRTASNTGRWDAINVVLALKSVILLVGHLLGRRGVVYLPISQNAAALLRDTLFIALAAMFGWKVAGHLRGSELRSVIASFRAPFRAWVRFCMRRLDTVAVMGASLSWVFEELVAPERIAVVPNGTPDVELEESRHDPHLGLFLSNLRRRKGVVQALEAALIVVREHEFAHFLFVGEWEDPRLERDLRARAQEAGGRIVFAPVTTGQHKVELLGSAGFLIFPPLEPEGHPRVVLEALAAGLPVITTDRGAIAETVVDGESGFVLCEPDPAALAERVLRLLRDEGLWVRMSDAARTRYLEAFTEQIADERLAGWLTELR